MDLSDCRERERRLREYFMASIPLVLKKPAGVLNHPFIDPGSIYRGNLWDWDSFWASYGILNLMDARPGEARIDGESDLRELCLEHAAGNVANFFDRQLPDGYIPMMVETKDEERPYLERKHLEGVVMNMHKPFLARQTLLVAAAGKGEAWAEQYRRGLERYFALYDTVYFKDACGLYVWADDIMIGMDNDPACFGRPGFSTASVFLNAFMVAELRAMAGLCRLWKDEPAAAGWEAKALRLSESIRAECWDPRDGFFYSVDVDIRTRRYDWFHVGLGVFWNTLPIKIRAWTGFLPLATGLASGAEAESLARVHSCDTSTFCAPFGVTTLAMDERMFDLRPSTNPSNWLGPIWTVASYCVFRGLMNYGYRDEAEQLFRKTLDLLSGDLEKTGTLHEYYNPFTGDPVMNAGFINWNILVLNMADELRGKASMDAFSGLDFSPPLKF